MRQHAYVHTHCRGMYHPILPRVPQLIEKKGKPRLLGVVRLGILHVDLILGNQILQTSSFVKRLLRGAHARIES